MAIWIPYKATPHERQKVKNLQRQRRRYCRLCGKEINGGGKLCYSCLSVATKEQRKKGG